MKNPDDLSYLRFTRPSQRDKAVHTLAGILCGMWIDGKFNPIEINELKEWCEDNKRLIDRTPFTEVIPKLLAAIEDGVIDPEELEDIRWVVDNCKIENEYFDHITTDIQQLHGILHGITSDGRIEETELRGLHEWILEREHLKGLYPYDEIESLIISVLKDGVIDEPEHQALMAFFNDFISYSLSAQVKRGMNIARGLEKPLLSTSGICAIDPEIVFQGRVFVFTGISQKAPRKIIAEHIMKKEGELSENVAASHYLVVGNNGNPAWAFACYGRKVEKAMQLRKEGQKIVIVNEVDFWDAISD